jgi:hypothetical protein
MKTNDFKNTIANENHKTPYIYLNHNFIQKFALQDYSPEISIIKISSSKVVKLSSAIVPKFHAPVDDTSSRRFVDFINLHRSFIPPVDDNST